MILAESFQPVMQFNDRGADIRVPDQRRGQG